MCGTKTRWRKTFSENLAYCIMAYFCFSEITSGNDLHFPFFVDEYRFYGTMGQTEAVYVPGVEDGYINFYALRRDFPFLKELSDSEIRGVLVESSSYISKLQLRLQGIRTTTIPVDTSKPPVISFRPPSYRRSDVIEVRLHGRMIGLLDRKGVGNDDAARVAQQIFDYEDVKTSQADLDALRSKPYADGVATFGEAIAEASRNLAVQGLFNERSRKVRGERHGNTVEIYAVMRWPFDIIKDGNRTEPAGFVIRQPHIGRTHGLPADDRIYTDPYGGRQGNARGVVVDMGGVIVQDGRLSANFGIRPGGKAENPQDSFPWIWGHQTAAAFARGDKAAVRRHLEEMLAPIGGVKKIEEGGLFNMHPAHDQRSQHIEAYNFFLLGRQDSRDGARKFVEELSRVNIEPPAIIGILIQSVRKVVAGSAGVSADIRTQALGLFAELFKTSAPSRFHILLGLLPDKIPAEMDSSFHDFVIRCIKEGTAEVQSSALSKLDNRRELSRALWTAVEEKIKAPSTQTVEVESLIEMLSHRAGFLPREVETALQEKIVALKTSGSPISGYHLDRLQYISTLIYDAVQSAQGPVQAALTNRRRCAFKIRALGSQPFNGPPGYYP